VAVCDVNQGMAEETARRFNIGSYYTGLSELLSRAEVDVVHVTTPPQTHLSVCTQAMEAGCHVLVEKPMALTVDDADKMIGTARAEKVRLCVVHNLQFVSMVLKAKSMVVKGLIGDIVGMNITDCHPREGHLMRNKQHWCHRLPGGIFGEMLPHPIYLAMHFLGKLETAAVHAWNIGGDESLVADELRVTLTGKGGIATIVASVNGPSPVLAVEVFGTRGSLHVQNGVVVRRFPRTTAPASRGKENLLTASQWLTGTASAALRTALGRYHDGHYTEIKRFVDALQEGTELPVTVDEAREATRLYQEITARIGQMDRLSEYTA
ncbi:MAG: Gfo/Idh/MocA family oxidoreductase, partial [Dehalococcoidia bacterium]|nr:Gfo/Idh/MocA family oxidoreductase [Dehalococcoidia bacterium]